MSYTLQGSAHADLSRTLLFFSVQEGQIALPKDREYPRKHEPILWQYESEAKSCNGWPELERVLYADRDSLLNPVNDTRRWFSSEDCLHPKNCCSLSAHIWIAGLKPS